MCHLFDPLGNLGPGTGQKRFASCIFSNHKGGHGVESGRDTVLVIFTPSQGSPRPIHAIFTFWIFTILFNPFITK